MFTKVDIDTTEIIEHIRTMEIAGFHGRDLTEMFFNSNKDNVLFIENTRTLSETLYPIDNWIGIDYHARSGHTMLVDYNWLVPEARAPEAPSVAWLIRTYFWKCKKVIIAFDVPSDGTVRSTEPGLTDIAQQEFDEMPQKVKQVVDDFVLEVQDIEDEEDDVVPEVGLSKWLNVLPKTVHGVNLDVTLQQEYN